MDRGFVAYREKVRVLTIAFLKLRHGQRVEARRRQCRVAERLPQRDSAILASLPTSALVRRIEPGRHESVRESKACVLELVPYCCSKQSEKDVAARRRPSMWAPGFGQLCTAVIWALHADVMFCTRVSCWGPPSLLGMGESLRRRGPCQRIYREAMVQAWQVKCWISTSSSCAFCSSH